jgi:hypothetical protein
VHTWTWPLQPPHNTSFPHIHTPLANLHNASSNAARLVMTRLISPNAVNRPPCTALHDTALGWDNACWMALLVTLPTTSP